MAAECAGRYAYAVANRSAKTGTTLFVASTVPTTPDFSRPDGLVTAVAQDAATGQVLMVAHMNRAAWEETLATGRAVYFSRSRGRGA